MRGFGLAVVPAPGEDTQPPAQGAGASVEAATDPALHPGLSLYLDLLRFSAAALVLFYHLGLARYGHEAVIVFFVLSGYVISYTAQNRDRTIERFAASRLTRLYSVSIPALLLTIFLDYVGYPLDPILYHGSAPLYHPITRFIISLLLFNETWFSVQAFSNGPYWSLSYELIYYILFACGFFFVGRRRIILLTGCLAIAGIRPLLLFPIWLMGSWAYFEAGSRQWSRPAHWVLFLSPALMFSMYRAHNIRLPFDIFDPGNSRQFVSDWFLGMVLGLHFLGAKNIGPVLARVMQPVSGLIRTLADYTFTLYMVHLPIILFTTAVLGTNSPIKLPAILAAVGILTALLGYFTEHQRYHLRRLLEQRLLYVHRRF